jgi:TPR repeat protein
VRHRLVVEDQQAFANEPILLAVVAVPTTSSGSLLLRGLAHGTRLSAGAALDEDGWELSLRDIGSAYVYAPPDFVGAMNATIALLSPSKKVIDSRPIRLEWTAKVDSLQPPTNNREIDPKIANAATKQEINPGTASAAARQEINPGASAAAVKPIDPQEAAALMERGRDLLRNGDVASAQLVFRRLAEAGKADAALALATTYDPRYLLEHNLVGIVGDEAKARAWYRRAKEPGSMEADHFLQPANTK